MSLRKGVIKRLYFVLLTAWISSFWSTCLLLEHEHWISLMCKFSPCSIFLSTEALTFNEIKWSSLYMAFADIISSILIIIFALRSFELVFNTWLQSSTSQLMCRCWKCVVLIVDMVVRAALAGRYISLLQRILNRTDQPANRRVRRMQWPYRNKLLLAFLQNVMRFTLFMHLVEQCIPVPPHGAKR